MSEEISRLPPQIQQRLLRLQQLQQNLQSVLSQKQQLEMKLNEVEEASDELEKLASCGPTFIHPFIILKTLFYEKIMLLIVYFPSIIIDHYYFKWSFSFDRLIFWLS